MYEVTGQDGSYLAKFLLSCRFTIAMKYGWKLKIDFSNGFKNTIENFQKNYS